MSKMVSNEVLQELTNKIQEIVNNYCWNLEHFTDSEVDDFFQASADEVTFYNGLINDKIESQNFLWSSKKIAEELAKAIIEANEYTDNMIKNISSIKLKYVTALPTSDISENTIYILKASDGTSKDTLNLYNTTDGWTSIGDFNISLDDYYTKTEIDTKMDLKANKIEVIANDKIMQTLDSTTNSADTVLSTSGLQTEMDKKANDDEVIKKTNITTTIDSTSTNDTVPSTKAVFTSIDKIQSYLSTEKDIPITTVDLIGTDIHGSVKYLVKSGICYVSAWGVSSDTAKTAYRLVKADVMPKPSIYSGTTLVHGDTAQNGKIVGQLYIDDIGALSLHIYPNAIGNTGFGSFSYPVAEQ